MEDILRKQLQERREQHSFRSLRVSGGLTDFCSNDYLGLARSAAMQEAVHNLLQDRPYGMGSTGSRLLAGNYPWIEEVEQDLAAFHQAPAALIFNSGYDANLGLFATVPQKGDTIIYDQLIHASIRDGIRLSHAQSWAFKHNDIIDLQQKIERGSGNIFVVVESVYSMDGDMAPLALLAPMCKELNCLLIVDEAHATGVIGSRGEGLVQHLGLAAQCFARVHTFGKAVGCHGAVVLGSTILRDYLINFCRAFIYTTALPPAAMAAIQAAYSLFPYMPDARIQLETLRNYFRQNAAHLTLINSDTPIQAIITKGNEYTRTVAAALQAAGLDVRPILHPTVPKGEERLRVVLHSFNTTAEIDQLLGVLKQ
ncbi:8-amino-7-oxononanoate synthase [Chitinophaga sp. Cy-1792]|uniref:aminotransferase class I/II-fold pyridoxal phosphate-dependent enzyme n=1 Tax=Chitinophaga sp. Cy-1792 TaxID=2608339 RepID=UPI00141E8955|nr:8-amino-7-oxononanoate synthase [Chitinophaga sp. Cy-1792]NIG54860.1 8-amino-7-oxononanoate synthase [Chitinophaga sp. Cy-1792]